MNAADIMTRELITVTPQTTLKDAVGLMLQYGVSGLPVLSSFGELVGIVTEGDLLRRTELGTERHLSRWSELLGDKQRQASDYVHAHAQHVAEVMTLDTVFVTPDASLNRIVAMMEAHHIKRLPVLEDGRLVGIVSRADLLRALVRELPRTFCPNEDDQQVQRCIRAQIDRQPWAPRACIRITVHDGVVELAGSIMHEAERTALRVLAENTAGVRRVVDQLVWIAPLSGMIVDLPKGRTNDAASSLSASAVVGDTDQDPKCPNWNQSA
jgi:CBS-domain-containing membrane protein